MVELNPWVSARLRPAVSAPSAARRMVREAGERLGLAPTLVEDTAQVVGMLVATSVRQANTEIALRVGFFDDCGFVEVTDQGSHLIHPALVRNDFALDMVCRLSDACGLQRLENGRQLWARVVQREAADTDGDHALVAVQDLPLRITAPRPANAATREAS